MNTREIDRILRRHMTKGVFKGVFSSSELPESNNVRYPFCLVTNTDCSCYGGTHWIAFYFDKRGYGHYFDSYGQKVVHPEWEKYLHKYSRYKYFVFKKRLQSWTSKTCGMFCIYYLLHRHNSPLSISDHSLMKNVNDKTVKKYVESLKCTKCSNK